MSHLVPGTFVYGTLVAAVCSTNDTWVSYTRAYILCTYMCMFRLRYTSYVRLTYVSRAAHVRLKYGFTYKRLTFGLRTYVRTDCTVRAFVYACIRAVLTVRAYASTTVVLYVLICA